MEEAQGKKKLKKNIFLNTLYQVLVMITPLLTAPYISRVLMSDGVGIYSYTQSLVTYFTMFAALGTVSYGTRTIAMYRDDKKEYSKNFWEIEILTVFTSMIMLVIWVIMAYFYAEYRIFLLILTFSILATCFDISWLYAGLEKYECTVSINSVFKILSIVLIFTLVKTKDDLWKYILIYSGSLALGNLSMWIFLPKTIGRCQIELKNIKTHFKETMVYFIPTIATTIYTVLDKTLIGALIQGETTVVENGNDVVKKVSEIENGYYEQATKIISLIKTVAFFSINGVMTSRASYLYGQKDFEGIKKLLKVTVSITSFLSIGAMFGLIGVADVFVPIFFGEGYDKTILLLYVMSPLICIIALSNVLGSVYYTPVGKRKESAIYLVIGSAVNLVLNIPLIIFYKSVGAAIASVIAECIITTLYFLKSGNIISLRDLISIIWKKLVAGVLMCGCIFVIRYFLVGHFSNVILLVLEVCSGIIIYIGMMLILRDDSIMKILDLVKSKFGKKEA